MTGLVLIGLIVVAVILWQRVGALQRRVLLLELGAGGRDVPGPRTEPRPASFDRDDWVVTAPAPVAAPVPPSPAESESAIGAAPVPVAIDLPEPVAAAVQAEPHDPAIPTPARRSGFEDIFGRYLPIWAGGITLAVAGFLIVKYSIDAGLLSPSIRVILGLLFGSGLIAGAEMALRRDDIARDPRIRQALAGAGIATLYASVLVAANLYHLIGPMTAFGGLALVTLAAGLLSIRFGAPSAVLGLVGGLAAPALVGSTEPDLPLLASWLALTVGGLSMLGHRQSWWWLGALAVAGGFGWGLMLIATGLHDVAAALSVGTLTLLLAIAFPLAIAGPEGRIVRMIAALAGCAQMAAIVATGGFAPLDWGLYALISIAVIWLAHREAILADLPLAGLGVGVLLAAAWPHPDGTMLAIVLAGGGAIYGLPALWRLWRAEGRLGDAGQLAAIGLAGSLIPAAHFWAQMPRADFSPLALLGAAITGGAAARGWRHPARGDDARFAVLGIAAIALAGLTAGLAAPVWALGPIVAAAAVAALLLGKAAGDTRIDRTSLIIGMAALATLAGHDTTEIARTIGLTDPVFGLKAADPLIALVRWLAGTAAALGFAWWSMISGARKAAAAIAALLFYVAMAQIVPPAWLALVPAAMLAAAALAGKRLPAAVAVTAGLLAIGWAADPLVVWMAGAAEALVGMPFLVTMTPAIDVTLIRIAAPAAALIVLSWRQVLPGRFREAGTIVTIILAMVAAHALWKHVFAIADDTRFAVAGMAERTLWEAMLLGIVLAAWRIGARRVATGLGIVAFLHVTWFTALLHDPLWNDQLAGPWLAPAYAIAFALLWLSARPLPGPGADRARDGIRMALILLLAASLLRQVFHGSLLSASGVTPVEDIGRSLLAIVIAIGFLQWGIRRGARDWRIVSLVLMLAAVGKVFLFDAAGLDGLLRIASFAALGFSLIGVGWLYSRYLPDTASSEAEPTDTAHAGISG